MITVFIIAILLFLLVCGLTLCKFSFTTYWVYYLFAFILYIPISLFFSNFYKNGFSDDPGMWGVFGDYIGGVYNVLITLMLAIISYRLTSMRTNKENVQQSAKEIISQIKTIQGNNYHHKSIEKLFRLIQKYNFEIDSILKQELIGLADNYTEVRVNNQKVNRELEKNVIQKLARLVNG